MPYLYNLFSMKINTITSQRVSHFHYREVRSRSDSQTRPRAIQEAHTHTFPSHSTQISLSFMKKPNRWLLPCIKHACNADSVKLDCKVGSQEEFLPQGQAISPSRPISAFTSLPKSSGHAVTSFCSFTSILPCLSYLPAGVHSRRSEAMWGRQYPS